MKAQDNYKKPKEETSDSLSEPEVMYSAHIGTMPCLFTEDEFTQELIGSEKSGIATEMEVRRVMAKWNN